MRSTWLLLLVAACGGGSSTDAGPDDDGGGGDAPLIDAEPADARILPDAVEPTCTPASGTNLGLQRVAQGLTDPVLAVSPPGDARLFVVEQPGRIRIIAGDALQPGNFLDIRGPVRSTGSEEGLLGLAFHPNYAQNGRFFVYYTADDPSSDNLVAEYRVSADPDVADAGSEQRIIIFDHPGQENHNGGMIAFGPDGYLYIGTGDGGGGGDPDDNAQDPTAVLGKILRIDVDSGDPYGIPSDNPLVGPGDEREEIWALGMRNPWRFSFDSQTGDLYIGDVGQNEREEIDVEPNTEPGGLNYGWDQVEGECCYPFGASCDTSCGTLAGMTAPVTTYTHGGGRCSVSGGYVYRGSCIPDIDGWYFFGDYCTGQVWQIAWPGDVTPLELTGSIGVATPSGFGQDATGELYIINHSAGEVHRIVPN